MCDKYVRILHTCDSFVRMWKSNESVTSVEKAIFLRATPPPTPPTDPLLKYKFGGSPSLPTAWWPMVTDREAGNRNAKFIIWPEFFCYLHNYTQRLFKSGSFDQLRSVVPEEMRLQGDEWNVSLSPSWEPKMWNLSTEQNLVWCLHN